MNDMLQEQPLMQYRVERIIQMELPIGMERNWGNLCVDTEIEYQVGDIVTCELVKFFDYPSLSIIGI